MPQIKNGLNCKIIAVCAQKGGTGKSTTCANLSVALAKVGKRVCLIDLDSQSNLTMSFGFNPDTLDVTITDIFKAVMDKTFSFSMEDYMLHAEGIDLGPADITFATVEKTIVGADSRENILKKFVANPHFKLKACLAELASVNAQLDLDKKPESLIIDEEESEPEDEYLEEEILEFEDEEEYEDAI